jgi:DNA (cytosine-5)-methyltransferase 1
MKYFSLFSGIGGLDYGLRAHKCVGISDIKQSSVQIYQRMMGNVKNFGDITEIKPKELPDFDLLVGGFPCQTFSIAGIRKGFGDRKGKMIFYIYDILKEKQPKYVVLENVKGIISHDKGKTIKSVVKLFSNLGYYVRVILLNSLYYGTAQSRERVIFLACKQDFPMKVPEIRDDTKRFRDIREKNGHYKFIKKSEYQQKKLHQVYEKGFNTELIGGYDRVGILTTKEGCGYKAVYEEEIDDFRLLTPLECERLQGFPDNWTEGETANNRYFALGNAVNCKISEYLFKDYLKGVWF